MKHLFIALTISAASFFHTAKANPYITPSVLESFRTTYVQAKDVSWTDMGDTYKVSFKLDGKYVNAYYQTDGTWLGTTSNVSSIELSPKLKANLRKEVKSGYISELFVLSGYNEDLYFAVVETPDVKKVFKSNNGRKWDLYQSIEK